MSQTSYTNVLVTVLSHNGTFSESTHSSHFQRPQNSLAIACRCHYQVLFVRMMSSHPTTQAQIMLGHNTKQDLNRTMVYNWRKHICEVYTRNLTTSLCN